jgi:serine/threonine-protein kinase
LSEGRLVGGRYRIVRKIAEGGMGEVYEAQHNLSKKTVALKILFPHIGKDEASRQRFLREVSAPAQIGHDAIVEVYDAGFDPEDGSLFVAMEMLDGEPLRDRLARGGISLDLLLDWFECILDPLAAAHAAGIVHRDLKPENIFVTKKRGGTEVIKILDFGIARDLDKSQTNVTHTGIAMGTPHYMAPEQAMSAKGVNAAADVWALGVMLYEALTGRPPFDGETASAIVVHACTQAHPPITQIAPHVPRPLADFIDRCLQKDPNYRPHDAGQMLAELQQVRQQIGSISSLAAAPAGTARATGMPQTGVAQQAFTPKGTAVLQPGSFPGAGSAPGYQTGPAGSFGAPNPSYASPAPGFGSSPGYATPPPTYGSSPFGAPSPSSAPGGYGTYGAPPSGPGYAAPMFEAPKKSSNMGLIIGVLVVGLGVFVIGGVALAFVFANDDDTDTTDTSTNGSVRVQTNVASGGEIFVDGNSRGPVVPNQRIELTTGMHQLELREAGQSVATASVTISQGHEESVTLNRTTGPNIPPNPPNNPPTSNRVQTFNGSLRPDDQTRPEGQYADTYPFDWTTGTTVQITLDSADFDTYMILRSPSGQQYVNDDRPGAGLNSGLTQAINETGRWQVLASSLGLGNTGDYTMTVTGP